MIVYGVLNVINGKIYIGQTTKSLEQRKKQHERDIKSRSPYIFHRALNKYGWENFKWYIIKRCRNQEDLNNSEIATISQLKTQNYLYGYNISKGGRGGAIVKRIVTEETKRRISESVKKAMRNPVIKAKKEQGTNNYLKEHRKVLTERVKKQWENPEFKQKAIERLKKRWANSEQVDKSRALMKKIWNNPERKQNYKNKLSIYWKNKDNSDKHKSRMRDLWSDPEFKKKTLQKRFDSIQDKVSKRI